MLQPGARAFSMCHKSIKSYSLHPKYTQSREERICTVALALSVPRTYLLNQEMVNIKPGG